MNSHDVDTVLGWRGRTVLDREGDKIGTFGEVYLDRRTDLPAWAGVRSGLLGRRESLVPLDDLEEAEGGDLRLPYDKDAVTRAPDVDADVDLDEDGERRLYEHYGRAYDDGPEPAVGAAGAADAPAQPPADEPQPAARAADAPAQPDGAVAADAPAGATGGDGPEVVRSEEEPVVTGRTERRPVERLRLKKVLVTEHVEQKVPVRREVVEVDDGTAPDEPPRRS